jgi:hypothetical protein
MNLRRALWWLTLVPVLLIGLSSPAWADDAVVVTNQANQANPTFHIDAALLALLIGTVIPVVVALLAKWSASSRVKALLNLVLSIGGGVLVAFQQAGSRGVTLYEIIACAGATFLASGVAHEHFWKPTGVTAKVGTATANFGVGAGIQEP